VPRVGKKHYPYTKKGIASAKKAKKKSKSKYVAEAVNSYRLGQPLPF
jgi:hypothetical protein